MAKSALPKYLPFGAVGTVRRRVARKAAPADAAAGGEVQFVTCGTDNLLVHIQQEFFPELTCRLLKQPKGLTAIFYVTEFKLQRLLQTSRVVLAQALAAKGFKVVAIKVLLVAKLPRGTEPL